MCRSTLSVGLLATPVGERIQELGQVTNQSLQEILRLVEDFLHQPLTPLALCQFERALQERLQGLGRTTLEWTVNQLEPEELPTHVCLEGECARGSE